MSLTHRRSYQRKHVENREQVERQRLTHEDHLRILQLVGQLGKHWNAIGKIMEKSPSTIKHFYTRYEKNGAHQKKLGAPIKITNEVISEVISFAIEHPSATLTEISSKANISTSSVSHILKDNEVDKIRKRELVRITRIESDSDNQPA